MRSGDDVHWSLLLDALPASAYVVDRELHIVAWNRLRERGPHGIPREAALGRPLVDVFPLDGFRRAEHAIKQVFETGTALEETQEEYDGSSIYHTRRLPVREDGSVRYVLSVFEEATDRVRAEQALRASEERFRLLFETMQEGFALHEIIQDENDTARDYRFLEVNPAFEQLTGLTREHILGRKVSEVLPGLEDEWLDTYAEVAASGQGTSFERYSEPLGRYFEVVAYSPRRGQFATVFSDVTRRKESERALHLWRRVIESLNQGVMLADAKQPDCPIVYVNHAFEAITGYGKGEVLGRNARFLQGPDTAPGARERLRQAVARREPFATEIVNYRKDGTPFWNLVALTPIRDEAGSVTHFVGIQTDVTERRGLEEELRQTQKMEAVGRLAGGVAHDFNNILGVILGYTEMLLRQAVEGDPARRRIEQILAAAERAASLTRQLLAFSRKQVLQPRSLDLNAVVEDLKSMLGRLIGEHIELRVVTDPGLHTVRADRTQIEQVLLNLALNARDAMPNGGTLTIATANADLDERYTRHHVGVAPGSYSRLAVSDSGTGMGPETQRHLFEPFFTTKEQGKGVGLGLSTVHGIVRQSGGHVTAYSAIGQGTTFKIYLPCEEEAARPTPAPAPPAVPPKGRGTILVVEDEESLRDLIHETLVELGYTVLVASSGSQGLEVAAAHAGAIDLVLTDVVTPGLGGRGLVDRLVQTRPGTRVIFMSGYTDDAIASYGILAPGAAFIEKPFSSDELARKIREALLGPRQDAEAEKR